MSTSPELSLPKLETLDVPAELQPLVFGILVDGCERDYSYSPQGFLDKKSLIASFNRYCEGLEDLCEERYFSTFEDPFNLPHHLLRVNDCTLGVIFDRTTGKVNVERYLDFNPNGEAHLKTVAALLELARTGEE